MLSLQFNVQFVTLSPFFLFILWPNRWKCPPVVSLSVSHQSVPIAYAQSSISNFDLRRLQELQYFASLTVK